MASPLVNLLTKSARQALPIIQGGVARGLSSRAITKLIVEQGLKISRSRSVLPAMRALRQLEAQGTIVSRMPGGRAVNTRRLPPAVTNLKKRYRYRVRLEGINVLGERETKHLYVTTDDPNFTPDMIEGKAREAVAGRADNYELQEITFSVEYGEQRADLLDFAATPGGRFIQSG